MTRACWGCLGWLATLLLACQHAPLGSSTTHHSSLGFAAQIPETWLAVPADALADNALDPPPGPLEDIDPALLADFRAALRTGEVEIFFRPGPAAGGFVDNISVRSLPGGFPAQDREVLAACEVLSETLGAAYGRPVGLAVCELRRLGEQRSLYVEASGAVAGIQSLQYLIEWPTGVLIVVTGTALSANLPTLRGELDAMVGSLTPHLAHF